MDPPNAYSPLFIGFDLHHVNPIYNAVTDILNPAGPFISELQHTRH